MFDGTSNISHKTRLVRRWTNARTISNFRREVAYDQDLNEVYLVTVFCDGTSRRHWTGTSYLLNAQLRVITDPTGLLNEHLGTLECRSDED